MDGKPTVDREIKGGKVRVHGNAHLKMTHAYPKEYAEKLFELWIANEANDRDSELEYTPHVSDVELFKAARLETLSAYFGISATRFDFD